MTMIQVHFIPAPGQAAPGVQGIGVPSGVQGLFAQLTAAAQNTGQPLTSDEAANIAQALPNEIAQNLPTDPTALKNLLNRVKQALSKGNTETAAALLTGTNVASASGTDTLQKLPSVRSSLVTLQPREVDTLIQHENQLLKQLGFDNVELSDGFNPEALADAYIKAGLTPEEAAVRVDIIGKMTEHAAVTPQQPLVVALPSTVSAPLKVEPLKAQPQIFLQAIQSAAQTIAPESEDIVSQILSLDSVQGVDDKGDPIVKTINVALIQSQPVEPKAVLPENEAKAAVNALADLAVPSKAGGMQVHTSQPTVEAAQATAEGKIVDNALNDQPAAHLLASVERSTVTNGIATQSGAAVSLAAGFNNQGDATQQDDNRQAAVPAIEDVTRINSEASAASFDRFLGQRLEAQVPVAQNYNAHGKIPTPAEQVNVSIRQLAENGGGEVRIKLMPEELGRIDIRLEIHNSQVRGVVMVERPEVLHDLARDLKHLQQALEASGLTVADNALSFRMQDQGGDQGQSREQNSKAPLGGVAEVASADDSSMSLPTGAWRDVTKLVDVNI